LKTYRHLYPQIYTFGNLHRAYRAARKGKRDRVAVASFEFDTRLYVRLSYDLHCITPEKFEHAARRLDESGRLLGGWQRKRAKEKARS
jgi:hypothetical protein